MRDEEDRKEVKQAFESLVNMSASEIEKWLDSDESKSVGQKTSDNAESTGHQSGRHIIRILAMKEADLSEDDYSHMHKVVSYIKRHLAQKPGESENSNWEYSLKNWGHNPNKK